MLYTVRSDLGEESEYDVLRDEFCKPFRGVILQPNLPGRFENVMEIKLAAVTNEVFDPLNDFRS